MSTRGHPTPWRKLGKEEGLKPRKSDPEIGQADGKGVCPVPGFSPPSICPPGPFSVYAGASLQSAPCFPLRKFPRGRFGRSDKRSLFSFVSPTIKLVNRCRAETIGGPNSPHFKRRGYPNAGMTTHIPSTPTRRQKRRAGHFDCPPPPLFFFSLHKE